MLLRKLIRGWAQFVLGIGVLPALVLQAHAAEQITLTNGFEISCHHHASVQQRVRLYMSSSNDNYIEVAPGEIASVENVPDPPAAETSASAPSPG